jgi:hypothetical protein
MIPWKMFVRSVGAVALLTAGALTAAQEMPFSHASRGTDPAVEVDETPTEEEAPDVDPAAEVDDEATTEPEVEAPDTDAPDTDAPEVEVEVTEVDGPAPSAVDVPKVKPAKEKAPAAKAKKDCHETHPWKGDHNNDGHCDQGWHNKDADWVADRGQKAAGAPAAAAAKGDHNNDGHADNGGKAADADRGARPETAPGQVKKAERLSEAGR